MIYDPRPGVVSKYRPEHVIIAERVLGRTIQPGDHVHHLNGDKADNRPENLAVLTVAEHRRVHRQLEEIGMRLVRDGRIAWVDDHYELLI